MAKTVGIIQARMRSERLPGKILSPLCGRPLLALLATRVARARVDEWWLATTSDPADDVTEAWGFELGLRVFRGHATDVLSRFLAVADETGADWLIRATSSVVGPGRWRVSRSWSLAAKVFNRSVLLS